MGSEPTQKPKAYLLIILPILCFGGLVLVLSLLSIFANLRQIPFSKIPDLNGMLIAIPAFVLWVPSALVLANGVLRIVPPLNRIAKEYSKNSNHPRRAETQTLLLRGWFLFGVICIPLIAMGFML
jgi:hypothetical protein